MQHSQLTSTDSGPEQTRRILSAVFVFRDTHRRLLSGLPAKVILFEVLYFMATFQEPGAHSYCVMMVQANML